MPPGIHLRSSPDTHFTGMSALLTCLNPQCMSDAMGRENLRPSWCHDGTAMISQRDCPTSVCNAMSGEGILKTMQVKDGHLDVAAVKQQLLF